MTKIIIESDNIEFEDKLAREMLDKIWTKIDTINERTKKHTLEIKDLERRLKKNETKKRNT